MNLMNENTPVALSYHEALRTILGNAGSLSVERIAVSEAIDRALAEDARSTVDVPPWDNASMDGYAIRSQDAAAASETQPVSLRVTGTIAAGGDASRHTVASGTAVRIMTGAPVPAGADCVICVEDTDLGGHHPVPDAAAPVVDAPGGLDAGAVRILSARDASAGVNIRRRAEDTAEGALLFRAGTTLTAAHLGSLASAAVNYVVVRKRPRVALIVSGGELATLDDLRGVREKRRIVSASSYSLPPMLTAAGATVTVYPPVPDDHGKLVAAISRAINDGCDLLITTGAVSAGLHDIMRDAISAAGGRITVHRCRIRPGGPMTAGAIGNTQWLGLPGNPVSSVVTTFLFAVPLIRQLGGHERIHHITVRAELLDGAETPARLRHFLRVKLVYSEDGVVRARLAGSQGSNLMRVLAEADALLTVPSHINAVRAGDVYQVMLMHGHGFTDVAR